MNKTILVALVLVIAGAGVWYWQSNSKESPSVSNSSQEVNSIDCGTDTACFAKNFRSCAPSKIYGGAAEIKEGTANSCIVFFASMDDPKYTGGERLTMNCTVKNTNTFKDEDMNAFSIYEKGAECSGPLYDIYQRISPR